ncbi:MAG: cytochrome-c peroxidase [Luteibaculaceae bacterium]
MFSLLMRKYTLKEIWLLTIPLTVIALSSCNPDANKEDNGLIGPTPYALEIPLFFPQMDIPQDNPLTIEGIELGRKLFYDKTLSINNNISCASCHKQEYAFSDPARFSTGSTGVLGVRNSMTLANIGWAPRFFWDGRMSTLEELVLHPIPDPKEMALPWEDAESRLNNNPVYPALFMKAFGTNSIDRNLVSKAIAQFMRTLISSESKFDRVRRGQDTFTALEALGFDLFREEGGDPLFGGMGGADCFHCHGSENRLFTDMQMRNNGLDAVFNDLGFGGFTGNPLDYGKFKVPTLRNVEVTGPFMHDGRFNNLMEVMEHYNSGGVPSETIDVNMKFDEGGLGLTEHSKQAVIAFMLTLTDHDFLTNPNFSNPHP